MQQWVTAIGFALGIGLVATGWLSWPILGVALVVGLVMLAFQFKGRGNPWVSLVWNVVVAGAIWGMARMQYREDSRGNDSDSWVAVVSRHSSDFARDRFVSSGLAEKHVSVLDAMLLGNRKALDLDQKQRFRGAGVQHLLALSGLHLGIFIALLSYLYLRKARFSRWRWPALWSTLILLWGYCLIAGMPQSLLRAMLMATLYYVSLFSEGGSEGGVNLANTLLIMLLIDPAALFDIGTQLSFSAVAALIWLYPSLRTIVPDTAWGESRWMALGRAMWSLLMVSVAAWLGTLPLCLFYFHQFQPWQPLVSVALVPMTTILLYAALFLLLVSIMGFWLLARPLAAMVGWYMEGEDAILDGAAQLPGSTIICQDIHIGHVVLLYLVLGILTVALRSTKRAILLSIPVLLAVFLLLYAV